MEQINSELQGSTDSFEDLFKTLVRHHNDPMVDLSDTQKSAEYFHSGLWLLDNTSTPPKP